MRVLHLSTFDIDSGAARGAYWLHTALRARAIDSTVLVGRKSGQDPTVHALKGPGARFLAKLRMRFDQLPLRSLNKTDEAFWSVGWLPSGVHRQINALKPDLVHLHWIGNGFMAIDELKQINSPIVWTLRDMWAFTGGCHYTNGCDHYRGMCGACPQLRSTDQDDFSRTIWTRKEEHWRDLNLWIVPLSEWLGDCVRESSLLRSFPIEVIANGVDTTRFRPPIHSRWRADRNLAPDARLIAFGAMKATSDPRKGFAQLQDALRHLSGTPYAEKTVLVVFGGTRPSDMPDLGIEVHFAGHINDDAALAELYSAADVAVIPSLEEAFGKTVIEAMACGTPVVAFDYGGPRDIIDHCVDGYLAAPFSPADLAAGIIWCFDETARNPLAMTRRTREKIVAKFDIDRIADRYVAFYERVLQESRKQVTMTPQRRLALRSIRTAS
ncbi:MAG TPA: glycosyltransferase family 4 protein [Magnetospirillaceae bacterium]